MEPDDIEIGLVFSARTGVDTRDLAQLALFAGSTTANYSDLQDTGFKFSRDGVFIEVGGVDFAYDTGVPVTGTIESMAVAIGNALAYSFGSQSYYENPTLIPVSTLWSGDPLAIAGVIFAGNDAITGSSIADQLYGFTGDDLVSGGSGDDLVYGEDGDDQASGGDGADKLYGGEGDDWLIGGGDDDKLIGGAGSDTASFEDKLAVVSVKLVDGKTAKAHIGTSEIDKLKQIENVFGGLGNDRITGDGADNELGGFAGNDTLKGKGGNDTLVGDWGSDKLVGGDGEDVFYFTKPAAGGSWFDVDTVKDFAPGVDSLHFDERVFSELEAGVLSDDNFYAAPGAFAGVGETYIVYDTTSGILYYDPSGKGEGYVYQVAVLRGAPTLAAADIFVVAAPPEDLP